MQDYFRLGTPQIFREINGLFRHLLEVLTAKRINYQDLKNALVPNPDRNEVVLVFDTTRIESSWYGREVFEKLIPIFDRRATHSVLCGDLIGDNELQDKLFEVFCHSIDLVRPIIAL